MYLGKDKFPLCDLTPTQAGEIAKILGQPDPKERYLNIFLRVGGRPFFAENPLLGRFVYVAQGSIFEEMGISLEEGNEPFLVGSLLYGGIFNHVNPNQPLLAVPAGLSSEAGMETLDFALRGREEIQETTRTVHELIGRIARLTAPEDVYRYAEIATLGAGLVHMAIIESQKSLGSVSELDAAHPELEDLEALFRELPLPA